MDYTVNRILQARILEWVAFPFSRGSSQPRLSNPGLSHCRWILYQLSHKGSGEKEDISNQLQPVMHALKESRVVKEQMIDRNGVEGHINTNPV